MNEATRPRSEPRSVPAARGAGVQAQQLDELGRGGERVGGDAAVAQVQRGAGDAVDLGDERGAGQRLAAVEDREVRERADVGVGGASDDDRAEAGWWSWRWLLSSGR